MIDDWITIYDLKQDKRHIKLVQDASLHRPDAGLVSKPALFGSRAWWNHVGTDSLPVHTLRGIVTRVYMGGHNDYPEFEMDDGVAKTRWGRLGEDSAYTPGRPIRIRYVEMKFKKGIPRLSNVSKCVLTVDVGLQKEIGQPESGHVRKSAASLRSAADLRRSLSTLFAT